MKRLAVAAVLLVALVFAGMALGWAGLTQQQAVARARQAACTPVWHACAVAKRRPAVTRVRCGKHQAWKVSWTKYLTFYVTHDSLGADFIPIC